MIDQRVSEGEQIELFGEKALTTTLPAQLALRYNLDIVPIDIERKFNNSFKLWQIINYDLWVRSFLI